MRARRVHLSKRHPFDGEGLFRPVSVGTIETSAGAFRAPRPSRENWIDPSMPKRTSHRGFTLVEMLAVVGVIAVLLAILLPAINIARRNAVWGTSQANLRQIGQLVALYAGDNRESIPATAFDYSASAAPGKPRSASPPGVNPPLGPLNVGSWADLLWTSGKFGPVVNVAGSASGWDYRFDSPDAALYASGWDGVNPFRSAEVIREVPPGGTGATPFGTGATSEELGDPGYFGGNPFFDARPPTGARPYSGNWWTTGQIRRPDASMYCCDSNLGEILEVNDGTLDPTNPNLNLVGAEFRYTGKQILMLFLDGGVGTFSEWGNLDELEKEQGVRVLGLDQRSYFPNP